MRFRAKEQGCWAVETFTRGADVPVSAASTLARVPASAPKEERSERIDWICMFVSAETDDAGEEEEAISSVAVVSSETVEVPVNAGDAVRLLRGYSTATSMPPQGMVKCRVPESAVFPELSTA